MNNAVLSVDAGGSSFKYALISCENLRFLTEARFFPIPSFGSKEDLLKAFRALFVDAQQQSSERGWEIVHVAFSVPGPFDCENGVSLMRHKWSALLGVPLKDAFAGFGIFPPQMQYSFIHDVHAFLAGEEYCGKMRGCRNVAAIVIGTGLGLGLCCGDEFLFNAAGGVRYSIFNQPYREGILEDYVSGRGISQAYKKLTGRVCSAKEIAEYARGSDATALRVFHEMGIILGHEIADILNRHAVEGVVIGGRVSCAYDLFGEWFKAEINNPQLLVYPSRMLESAAMLGAAAWGRKLWSHNFQHEPNAGKSPAHGDRTEPSETR